MSIAPGRRVDRGTLAMAAVSFCGLVVMAMLVAMGVSRPEPRGFAPSPVEQRPARGQLVGPMLVTVDASAPERWRFFSFEDGSVRSSPGPLGWDLAFRRFQVIANGGAGFAGRGAIADLGETSFDEIEAVPTTGYVVNATGNDTVNAAVEDWYDYSYFSHLLSPKPRVYAIRTADGLYAKLQFVGYYCPDAVPGCITFRYVYQGAGGTHMTPGRTAEPKPTVPA